MCIGWNYSVTKQAALSIRPSNDMNKTTMKKFLKQIIFLGYLSNVFCQEKKLEERDIIGCQQKSTSGRSYEGGANTTVDGIPCQKWSATQPHDHRFTNLGDHNFCRNPAAEFSGVWCHTTNPEIPYQYCSVPPCPHLKALDFSLDNDRKPDENNSYTHAFLRKENLPLSFTICAAFIVEAWTKSKVSELFSLRHDNGNIWNGVAMTATETYTQFGFQFEDSSASNQSETLFYPLQCTMCIL